MASAGEEDYSEEHIKMEQYPHSFFLNPDSAALFPIVKPDVQCPAGFNVLKEMEAASLNPGNTRTF